MEYIKTNAPYPYTVISTYSNAANGYFSTGEAFEYGFTKVILPDLHPVLKKTLQQNS